MTINHSRLTINDPADGWNVVAELQWWATSGTLKKSYIWGVDMSGTLQGAGGVSGLLSMRLHDLAKTLFYCYDGNGNVIRLIEISSEDKETVGLYTYDPFGRLLTSSGTYMNYNDYLFSTKRYERQWGLNYYGYRFYSADLGRWITRDPIGEQGGLNLYGFVGNGPNTFIDLFGLMSPLRGCCNGKQYDPRKQCCCEEGIRVIHSKTGIILNDEKIDTGIIRYIYRPTEKNDVHYAHSWLKWPSTGEKDLGSAGFHPRDINKKEGYIEYPDSYMDAYNKGLLKDENIEKHIEKLSPCEYDINLLRKCLFDNTKKDPGEYIAGKNDCKVWSKTVLEQCKKISEGRCTMSEK